VHTTQNASLSASRETVSLAPVIVLRGFSSPILNLLLDPTSGEALVGLSFEANFLVCTNNQYFLRKGGVGSSSTPKTSPSSFFAEHESHHGFPNKSGRNATSQCMCWQSRRR